MKKLILASGSPYRQLLLRRLQLPFETAVPRVAENRQPGESGHDMARRLATAKARVVALRFPDSVVIGSDQVAQLDNAILGKPGSVEIACHQLSLCSGNRVTFYTGLCVIEGTSQLDCVETFHVLFRNLSDREIQRYVDLEQPLDCAGSFKCEGLGSVLFERLEGEDPTALEGLPLIRLSAMLRTVGLDPLGK